MTREEVLAKVRNLVADYLYIGEDQVKPESNFLTDLGADSLDVVEMTMQMEEEFDLTLTDMEDDEAASLHTVGEVVEFILKLEKSRAVTP